jgi:serine/threonine-protein kinase
VGWTISGEARPRVRHAGPIRTRQQRIGNLASSETTVGPSWTGFSGSWDATSSPGSLSLSALETVIPAIRGPARVVAGAEAGSAVAIARTEARPALRSGLGRLGRYYLIERVGRGRQADVWRALCADPIAEEVALKVLPATVVHRDPRRRAQLRHEAERGARLASPALLPTYEYGEVDGAVFMAMPFVIGCTLAEVIAQRQDLRAGKDVARAHKLALAPEPEYTREIATLMLRVARAVQDAHDGLVVHRDIKPGNILVRHDHSQGVFLCDFGLARDLDVATPSQLRDGAGSPLYMAPERLLKRQADEVRSDVFALGVTLCEALTLATPIEVPPEMPRELWAGYLASAKPREPSEIQPSIPAALERSILRATARDPALRHATAAEFAEELRSFVDGGLVRRAIPGSRQLASPHLELRRRPVPQWLSWSPSWVASCRTSP